MFRALAICCTAATLLAGCAGTAETTGTVAANAAPNDAASKPSEPIPRGKARLALTRVSAMLYVGAPASVKVNGQPVAELWSGKSSTVDIAPGATTVTVDAWSYPGTWTLELNAKAGQAYALEISPRSDSYVPGLFGVVGGAIDASANKNAGAFQMRILGGPESGEA